MPDEDESLARQVRKLSVAHAETRWLRLRLDDDVQEIKQELRQIRATQGEHSNLLRSHDEQLRDHGEQLRDHGEQLRAHGDLLRDHGEQLRDHGEQLRAHGDLLQEHTARFDSVDAQLRSLTQLVGQVLDRLPEPPGE